MTYNQKRKLIYTFVSLDSHINTVKEVSNTIFDKLRVLEELEVIDFETSISLREEALIAKNPNDINHLIISIVNIITKL